MPRPSDRPPRILKYRPLEESQLFGIRTRRRLALPDYVHSSKREHSYITNASAHRGAASVFKIDVKRFFASVMWRDVFAFFRYTMKCAPDVSGLLADLCTVEKWAVTGDPSDAADPHDRHLPTGSSLSQSLAYWSFAPMFAATHRIATARGFTITVYVDDITISTDRPRISLEFRRAVHGIIARNGLEGHKDRYWSHGRPALVTGAVIAGNDLRLPNGRRSDILHKIDRLKALPRPKARIRHLRALVGQLWAAVQLDDSMRGIAKEFKLHLRHLERRYPAFASRRNRRPLPHYGHTKKTTARVAQHDRRQEQ